MRASGHMVHTIICEKWWNRDEQWGGCRGARGSQDAVTVPSQGSLQASGAWCRGGSASGLSGPLKTKGDFMAEPPEGPLCPPGAASATAGHLQALTHPRS